MRRAAVRAVLFDMDGVLVHSFGAWALTVSEVSVRFGLGAVPEEAVARIWGQGVAADAETLYPGRSLEEIRRAYDEVWPRHVGAVAVNPEAHAVLRRLARAGVRRAVVTNTQQSLAEGLLEAKGLRAALDVVAALAPGRREKPAPDLLLHAMQALGVDPSAALMVGDTRYDEEAAAAGGVRFLRYDLARGESLAEALAAHVDALLPRP